MLVEASSHFCTPIQWNKSTREISVCTILTSVIIDIFQRKRKKPDTPSL